MDRVVVDFVSFVDELDIEVNVFDFEYISLSDLSAMTNIRSDTVSYYCTSMTRKFNGNHPYRRFIAIDSLPAALDALRVRHNYKDYLKKFQKVVDAAEKEFLKGGGETKMSKKRSRDDDNAPDWVNRLESALDMQKIEELVDRLEKATADHALHNYICTPEYTAAVHTEVHRRVDATRHLWEKQARDGIEARIKKEIEPKLIAEAKKRIEAKELVNANMKTLESVAKRAATKAPIITVTDADIMDGLEF